MGDGQPPTKAVDHPRLLYAAVDPSILLLELNQSSRFGLAMVRFSNCGNSGSVR